MSNMVSTLVGMGCSTSGVPDVSWCQLSENYFVSKYPVTYQQMKAFLVADDGYMNDIWWEPLALVSKRWDQDEKLNNYPTQNVNWYTAIAYCRWMSEKLKANIRLPLVKEWASIIHSTQGNLENAMKNNSLGIFSNNYSSGLYNVVRVGSYPNDTSSEGVCDLWGNVSTWCMNEVTSDDTVDLSSGLWKAVCGGSFLTTINNFVVIKESISPINIRSNVGIRLVKVIE